MKIAIVAAEIAPWAKAGGLADVIGALPGALKRAGADPAVIVPAYSSILENLAAKQVGSLMTVHVGADRHDFRVLTAEDSYGVPIYLIDHPGFFARAGIYGDSVADYPDNLRRFIFFGRAAAMIAADISSPVVHAHDWHAAVTPIVLRADDILRLSGANTIVAYTIHNLAFQGGMMRRLSLLGDRLVVLHDGRFGIYGRMNLMKGAVMLADGYRPLVRGTRGDFGHRTGVWSRGSAAAQRRPLCGHPEWR